MTMRFKFGRIIVLATLCGSVQPAAVAQPVTDPVREWVRLGKVNKGDEVISVTFDWNEDGKDDFLVTTGADVEIGGRYTDWNVWLSNSSGAFDMVGSVTLTPGIISVARLPESGNNKAVVASYHVGGGLASLKAYYLTSDRKLDEKDLGMVDEGEGTGTAEQEALERRVFEKAEKFEMVRKPAAELWPEGSPVNTPPQPLPKASKGDADTSI